MISAPIQFDAQLDARFAQERAEHLARLEQVKALAMECLRITRPPKMTKRANRPKRRVQCIETKRIFDSVTDAAKWADVWPTSIYTALKAKRYWKRGTKWHWKAA